MSDNAFHSTVGEMDYYGPPIALVVEDLPDIREWLGIVLQQAFPKIQVERVGTLAAARAWLSSASRETIARTRLALVDLGLPDGSGTSLIAELAEKHPTIVTVVASIYDDDAHLFESIAAGAQGYLLKDQETSMLVTYLQRIERGEPPLSPAMARRMMRHFRQHPVRNDMAPGSGSDALIPQESALTPQEKEVLDLVGAGTRIPEVALQLKLPEQTVASYVKDLYRKLRVSSRAGAALDAVRRGLA